MDFSPPVRKPLAEPFVPMINVVFLLLIFFLMTAQIAPPDPFEVIPPGVGTGAAPTGPVTLHLSPEGEFAFGDGRGEAALAAVKDAASGAVFLLRADREMKAATLAGALAKLSAAGVERVEIVTAPR